MILKITFIFLLQYYYLEFIRIYNHIQCVKSVRIPSFSGPYFPAFGLNMERYSVIFLIKPFFWDANLNIRTKEVFKNKIKSIFYHFKKHSLKQIKPFFWKVRVRLWVTNIYKGSCIQTDTNWMHFCD